MSDPSARTKRGDRLIVGHVSKTPEPRVVERSSRARDGASNRLRDITSHSSQATEPKGLKKTKQNYFFRRTKVHGHHPLTEQFYKKLTTFLMYGRLN